MSEVMPKPKSKPKSSWVNLAVDYGPLLVFFFAYRYFSPKDPSAQGLGAAVAVTKSTMVFMVATIAALIVSKWRLGKISPMLWLSTMLIVGFGSLTVVFWAIRVDPGQADRDLPVVCRGAVGGLMRGKAMLRLLLQAAFDGLDEPAGSSCRATGAFSSSSSPGSTRCCARCSASKAGCRPSCGE